MSPTGLYLYWVIRRRWCRNMNYSRDWIFAYHDSATFWPNHLYTARRINTLMSCGYVCNVHWMNKALPVCSPRHELNDLMKPILRKSGLETKSSRPRNTDIMMAGRLYKSVPLYRWTDFFINFTVRVCTTPLLVYRDQHYNIGICIDWTLSVNSDWSMKKLFNKWNHYLAFDISTRALNLRNKNFILLSCTTWLLFIYTI